MSGINLGLLGIFVSSVAGLFWYLSTSNGDASSVSIHMAIGKKAVTVAIVAFGTYLLKQYMNGGVCTSLARIDGKVVIVTGANTGIGKETALDLVRRGGKVYMACRSLDRAHEAVEDIKKITGVDDSCLPIIQLDLNSLQSVRNFAAQFKSKEKKLDILVNNAGIMWVPFSKTEDGFEKNLGVNHLGPFLLTNLLMDRLVAGAPSRVVNMASIAHERGTINFDDLMSEKSYSKQGAYCQSKLANVLFTRELARRLEHSGVKGVTAYSLHPGIVRTEILREIPWITNYAVGRMIFYITSWPFFKEPMNGAQTSICCAVDERLAAETGKYYCDCVEKAPIAEAQNDMVAKRLWDVSAQLVKLDKSETHPSLMPVDT